MKQLYDQLTYDISKIVTNKYSTSFSLGILALNKKFRHHIYAIYGLVRVADEIVDTFHDKDKKKLLDELKSETHKVIQQKISTNPILHSFQLTVNKFNIPLDLVDAFFYSMEMDIYQGNYNREDYDKYVYGSAEVVGLMCLKVFINGNQEMYEKLRPQARALGSAFQKVNFLRDLGSDVSERNRIYLPSVFDVKKITDEEKNKLVNETEKEFNLALDGIKKLPIEAKIGVYSAYLYYKALLKKVKKSSVQTLLNRRIRVPNFHKFILMIKAFIDTKFLKRV